MKKSEVKQYPRVLESLLLVVKIGKVLGIFPVRNAYGNDEKSSYDHCIVVSSAIVWFIDLIIVSLTIADWLYVTSSSKFVNLVYNSEIFFSLSFFIYFTKKWPKHMKLWKIIDQNMDPNYKRPKNFKIKIEIILMIYSVMSLGNHVGSPMHSVLSLFQDDSNEIVEFNLLPQYNRFFSKLLTVHSVLGKTTMHYRDIFLIIISLVLKEKFRQINDRIRIHKETICIKFWKEIREDYNRLAQLVAALDEDLGFLAIVASGYNGFWILNFFYQSYMAKFSSSANLYFFYPFAYILLRFFSVFLSGAILNNESVKPSTIIQFSDVPVLNVEISRLITQIEFDAVFLSGCQCFKMKKEIILSVLGAIVTYELTLLQYHTFGTT